MPEGYYAGYGPGTVTHVADNTVDAVTAETILGANSSRKFAMIQNNGTAAIRVSVSADAPTATLGIRVPAGEHASFDQPNIVTAAIKAISESGSNAVGATEVV